MRKSILASSLAILSCALIISTANCQTMKTAVVGKSTTSSKTSSLPVVTIELEKGGIIKYEMYADTAPKTVARMTELIQKGFYDPKSRSVTWHTQFGGTTTATISSAVPFHRVIPGFMAQTGDPTGTGTGGSGQNIVAEFNERKHVRGTVAMARSMDPNSADSQFYICFSDQPGLDMPGNRYTIFGQVISGMDIVDGIKQGDKIKKITVKVPTTEKKTK